MKTFLKATIAFFMSLVAGVALAGSVTGIIDNVIVASSSELILIHTTGTASGQPGCATSAGWFVLTPSTAAGASQLRVVEMASVLGRTITLAGAGTCNATVTNAENLAGVTLAP